MNSENLVVEINQAMAVALQNFVDDMDGRFGEIPKDCEAYSDAKLLIFKYHDLAIIVEFNKLGVAGLIKLVSKTIHLGYAGGNLGLLVDVINEEFPEHSIEVFCEYDTKQSTAKSVLLLESWCDAVLGLSQCSAP